MSAELPEQIIEQAAKALREMHGGISEGESLTDAEYILAAVLPGIREHIAQEIEGAYNRLYGGLRLDQDERRVVSTAKHCARIAREGRQG